MQTKPLDAEKKENGRLNSIVEAQERTLIIDALKATQGNQSKAAKLLGTTKRIIHYKINKMGIDPKKFKHKN